MKKWKIKVSSARFGSEESMNNFLREMGNIGWEIVSVFPNIFPEKELALGDQEPEPSEDKSFTFIFKQEVPQMNP
jgi:hypothetical protein